MAQPASSKHGSSSRILCGPLLQDFFFGKQALNGAFPDRIGKALAMMVLNCATKAIMLIQRKNIKCDDMPFLFAHLGGY
jgi:hypothetical protein